MKKLPIFCYVLLAIAFMVFHEACVEPEPYNPEDHWPIAPLRPIMFDDSPLCHYLPEGTHSWVRISDYLVFNIPSWPLDNTFTLLETDTSIQFHVTFIDDLNTIILRPEFNKMTKEYSQNILTLRRDGKDYVTSDFGFYGSTGWKKGTTKVTEASMGYCQKTVVWSWTFNLYKEYPYSYANPLILTELQSGEEMRITKSYKIVYYILDTYPFPFCDPLDD